MSSVSVEDQATDLVCDGEHDQAFGEQQASRGFDEGDDDAIEKLNLNDTAREAAYLLKKQFPTLVFTSGRRDRATQARAMAANVAVKRTWITETYKSSSVKAACEEWLRDHPEATSKAAIQAGLEEVLEGFDDDELVCLSKHFSGGAFDIQPVTANADKIKAAIRSLPGKPLFLEKEGGLIRWHVQY